MKSASLAAVKEHIARLKKKRGFLLRHGEIIALGLLIALASLINVVWISQDTRPQPGADPNHYLIKTLEFVDRLREQRGAQFWQSVAGASLEGRPPLYQLLGAPFIYLFGRSEDAAVSINVVFEAILLLCTYGIGRLARNGKAGLLAAFLVTTYPPIVNLSRIYRPHAAAPACVALSVWLLLLLLKTRSVKIAWMFGASLAFGMLVHLNFLYLLPAPAAVFGLYALLFQTPPRRPPSLKGAPRWLLTKLRAPFALCGLLPAALIAAGLTAVWYLSQSQTIFALRQAVLTNWSDQAYGFHDVPHSFWWYALTAPGAISYVFSVLLTIGLVVSTIKRRLGPSVPVITFLTMYGGFGLRLGDLGWLHFASVLPVAAALTAIGVVEIHERLALGRRIGSLLSTGMILVCIGVAAFNFSVVTWGVQPWSRPIATALGAPLDSHTCRLKRMNMAFCPNQARDEDWRVSDILQAILDDPECQARGCHLAVVPKLESLNSFILDYHLVRDFPEFRERVTVSSADEWGGEPADGEWVVSDYVVYIEGWLGPDGDRRWRTRADLTRFLDTPPPVFADVHREIASFVLPGGWTAKLIKRTAPLTPDLGIRIYEEALEAVPSDVMLYEKLGYLYLRTGNWSRAEESFRQAAQINPTLSWPHRALGYLYQRQNLEDQAAAEFRKAIEREPFEPKGYRYLAGLLEAQGDLQGAIEVYEQAAQNNPRLVWPRLELGSLYVRENRLSEALAAYQEAARIEPWNQTARANLQDVHWSLASSLGTARAYTDRTPLIWWRGEGWIRPYPYNQDVLVGRSVLDVEGLIRPDQIHLHPFSADQDTYLRFDVEDCHYDVLQIGYGLADQVAGLTNGVRCTLRASVDGGNSYAVLWDETVTDSVWQSQNLPLMAYRGGDVTFQLAVDALGDDGYDWLQTTVRLFPAVGVWDLATNLATVQVTTTDVPLSWSPPLNPPLRGEGKRGRVGGRGRTPVGYAFAGAGPGCRAGRPGSISSIQQ